MIKNLPAIQGTWIPSLVWEDSPREGNGYPLQYSCLGNPMDRGAWRAAVHGITKGWTQLNTRVCTQVTWSESLRSNLFCSFSISGLPRLVTGWFPLEKFESSNSSHVIGSQATNQSGGGTQYCKPTSADVVGQNGEDFSVNTGRLWG